LIKIATPADSEPLLGHTGATDVIAALRELTAAAVIVTDGEDPLTLSGPGGRDRFPVLPVRGFADATGAGDVLLGSLAAALALSGTAGSDLGSGLSAGPAIAAALPEAMAAAALSTRHRGGAPHATRDEVRALLRNHV
jgi:sugar/nucleoside kinase (ribokinase family)